MGTEIKPKRVPKTSCKICFFVCAPLKTYTHPRGGGARHAAPLGFRAFLLEIAAGASAGCKIEGSRVWGATLGAGGRS